MEEPPWKKLKLSLERPYKDDDGEPIPVLLDITDGQHVFEPYVISMSCNVIRQPLSERRIRLQSLEKTCGEYSWNVALTSSKKASRRRR